MFYNILKRSDIIEIFEYLCSFTWKVLKCAGEGWRRSVGPMVWEMKKYYLE
jgi:hypothetical protein